MLLIYLNLQQIFISVEFFLTDFVCSFKKAALLEIVGQSTVTRINIQHLRVSSMQVSN